MGHSTELWDALLIAVSQLHSHLHSVTLLIPSIFPHLIVYSLTYISLASK